MVVRDVDWQLDQSRVLSGFSYHDGIIVEANYSNTERKQAGEASAFTIKIRNLDSQIVVVCFKKLISLSITEWDIDPIVNDIEVWVGSDGRSYGKFWDRFWTILLSASRIKESNREGEIDRLLKSQKDAYFVQLYASYGASFALICREILVQEE